MTTSILIAPVTIRPLEPEELPLCVPLGQAFHAEYQLPGRIDPEVFVQNWTNFIMGGQGVIFSAWRSERVIGGLGAVIVPDLLDARLVANELFWFIEPDHRGGVTAIRLLQAFEDWALVKGATERRIARFAFGKMGERLHAFYSRRGYCLVEMSYVKPCFEEEPCLSYPPPSALSR